MSTVGSEGIETLRFMVRKLEDERKEVEGRIDELEERVRSLEREIAKMSVKMGIWAAVGAAIPVLAAYVLKLLP